MSQELARTVLDNPVAFGSFRRSHLLTRSPPYPMMVFHHEKFQRALNGERMHHSTSESLVGSPLRPCADTTAYALLAVRLAKLLAQHGPGPLTVVECGGAYGEMARVAMEVLPAFGLRVREYFIVTDPQSAALQQRYLTESLPEIEAQKLRWARPPPGKNVLALAVWGASRPAIESVLEHCRPTYGYLMSAEHGFRGFAHQPHSAVLLPVVPACGPDEVLSYFWFR